MTLPRWALSPLVTVLAAHKVFSMVTLKTKLNVRFGRGRNFVGSWVCRMGAMAAHAIGNVLPVVGHIAVGRDLLAAGRDEAGRRGNEFFERAMTFQASRCRAHTSILFLRLSLPGSCRRVRIRDRKEKKHNHYQWEPMFLHKPSLARRRG